jgi:hypothetical protein
MESPKSRAHKDKKLSFKRRKHRNKKFYNSADWKRTRMNYLRHYRNRLYNWIPLGRYKGIPVSAPQQSYILSLDYLPCETCLKLYIADAYDHIEPGIEVDHINPVNSNNALDSEGYGDPFDIKNLQLLCKRHHAKKSQRERRS